LLVKTNCLCGLIGYTVPLPNSEFSLRADDYLKGMLRLNWRSL